MRACVWKHMSDFVGLRRPEKDTGCFDGFLLYIPRCGLELEARACRVALAVYMDAGETTLVLTLTTEPSTWLLSLLVIWLYGLERTMYSRIALSSPPTCLSLTVLGLRYLLACVAQSTSVHFWLLSLLIGR